MMNTQYWLCCLFSKTSRMLLSFTARQPSENRWCRDTSEDNTTQCAFRWARQNSLQDLGHNWNRLTAGGVKLLAVKWVLMRATQLAAHPLHHLTGRGVWVCILMQERKKFYSYHHHEDLKCWSGDSSNVVHIWLLGLPLMHPGFFRFVLCWKKLFFFSSSWPIWGLWYQCSIGSHSTDLSAARRTVLLVLFNLFQF